MSLLGGVISISNISTLLFVLFAVLLGGYALGRITIKGISLGDAGVFIIALLMGALAFHVNESGELLFALSSKPYDFNSGLSLIESFGLVLFVTSVGFIAGPKFFGNFKRNFKSYVLLGVIIILAGGLAAFLVYNFHPAKVFMGDTGSLFLGGAVAALAFAMDMPLILIPVGIIYIAETGSVILQVSYFKATHGKRLFKMSPLHHHLELSGWSEMKLVAVFSLITLVCCVLAFLGVQGRY